MKIIRYSQEEKVTSQINLYFKSKTETASRWQQVTVVVTESFIQSIRSNGWFI